MAKLPEFEELTTLRHRWARTIEMWCAYQTFLNREVLVGPHHICSSPQIVQQTTHTLLACYYSFLYSLFDKSGVQFDHVSEKLLQNLPDVAKEVRDQILSHWEVIAEPITQIRHNIGFHGAPKRKGMRRGYAAYKILHPLSSEYVMTLMRVFFRLVANVYEVAEHQIRPTTSEDIDSLMRIASELRSKIDATPTKDSLEKLLREVGKTTLPASSHQ